MGTIGKTGIGPNNTSSIGEYHALTWTGRATPAVDSKIANAQIYAGYNHSGNSTTGVMVLWETDGSLVDNSIPVLSSNTFTVNSTEMSWINITFNTYTLQANQEYAISVMFLVGDDINWPYFGAGTTPRKNDTDLIPPNPFGVPSGTFNNWAFSAYLTYETLIPPNPGGAINPYKTRIRS